MLRSKKGYFLIQDVKFEDQLSEVEKQVWESFKNVTANFLGEIIGQKNIVKWWLILCSPAMLGVKYVFKGAFLRLLLRLLRKSRGSERCGQRVSDFTMTFPMWKCSTKAIGVPECWLIIAGHLEETFHRQNITESSTVTF